MRANIKTEPTCDIDLFIQTVMAPYHNHYRVIEHPVGNPLFFITECNSYFTG